MTETPAGFLSDYLSYTGHYHYPPTWNLACGMALVGAACMDRISFMHRAWPVIPYIHPFFIGPSGTGKGACVALMRRVQKAALPGLTVIADVASTAGLLADIQDGIPTIIVAEEATSLLGRQDWQRDIIPTLTRLADNNDFGKRLKNERRRLDKVRTAIILGSNEEALREDFDPRLIKKGLATRFIWLVSDYIDEPANGKEDGDAEVQQAFQKAVASLQAIGRVGGQAGLSEEGRQAYSEWHEGHRNVRPDEPALAGWYSRRHMHLLRCALIFALSTGRVSVSGKDIGEGWLFLQQAEHDMMLAFNGLGMSAYGKYEERMQAWMVGKGWLTGSQIKQRWASQLGGGCKSVDFILSGLLEQGKLAADPPEGGRGARYRCAQA